MADNLRDRIAAAIAKADQDWCSDNPLYEDMADAVIADAVIAELGLRQEWGALDEEDGGILYDTPDEIKLVGSEEAKTRFITGWEPWEG